jgi:2-dehydropantoate 2-reductase
MREVENLKIGVIGGGAVGLLISAYLSRKHDITLYTKTEEQAISVRTEGIHVIGPNPWTAYVKSRADVLYKEEILIIAVKQYSLPSLFGNLKQLPPKKIVFVQNGITHIGRMKELAQHELYIGVVEHGALKKSPNTVHHTGIGKIRISPYDGGGAREFIDQLNTSDPLFLIQYEEDWEPVVLKKLAANAVINPLTALFRMPNGHIVSNPYVAKLAKKLFHEVCDVLEINDKDDLWEYIESIAIKTKNNRSSMLSDIEHHKKTEIDSILGDLIQKGKEKGAHTCTMEFLYNAIKGLENQEER